MDDDVLTHNEDVPPNACCRHDVKDVSVTTKELFETSSTYTIRLPGVSKTDEIP